MERKLVIVAEHAEGKLKAVTHELVTFARKLQLRVPVGIMMVVLGHDTAGPAYEAAETTGLDVTAIKAPGLESYNCETYKTILGNLLEELNPVYVCIAHTTQGADFAPALAVRLNAACITAVERLYWEDTKVLFIRAIAGGKLEAQVLSTADVTILTVQPGMFKASTPSPAPGGVRLRTISFSPAKIRNLATRPGMAGDSALSDAKVIVSAGRGIGKKENLEVIYELARVLPRSAVAGSRPVCDIGWLEYKQQVGQTGATVAPNLYIACGISGAMQHVVGMRGSGFIVAINSDPTAAIFNIADVCVVEDLGTFMPSLLQELARRRNSEADFFT